MTKSKKRTPEQPKNLSKRPKTPDEQILYDELPPKFSFQFTIKHHNFGYDSLDDKHKVALIDRLKLLGQIKWSVLKQAPRHGLGYEQIERSALNFSLPDDIPAESNIIAFRFFGMAPILGFRSQFDWGYEGVLDWPYQLMASSPCVDAGTVNIPDYTWLTGDIMGNTRLVGETVDMGAYEFSGSNDYFVDFEGEPKTGVIPLTVQFSDTSVGYEIASWQWDFNNDGIFDSTEQNPSFTYYTTGHHTVRLVINNGQASRVKPEYINPRPIPITGGTLRGIVTSGGYPLPDASVTVLGTTLIGTTDEIGLYTIENIIAGTYSLRAFKTDYDSYTQTGVVISIGEVTTQHFALSPVSDSDIVGVPLVTGLVGNYPNPFNPETTISFTLAKQGLVEIDVYNIKGERVRGLVNGLVSAGNHQVIWDGADDMGRVAGSGMYFYRLKAGGVVATRKMLLLK